MKKAEDKKREACINMWNMPRNRRIERWGDQKRWKIRCQLDCNILREL